MTHAPGRYVAKRRRGEQVPGKRTAVWKIEPHTAAKHEILRRYLNAWLPIMTRHNNRVVYIDGFAGPGRYKDGEPGSPIIALRAALEHSYPIANQVFYLFIKQDDQRAQNLEAEIKALGKLPPNLPYQVKCGNFDDTVSTILDQIEPHGGLVPTFAFVDPFGWSQTPMRLLQRLLSNARCEVFVTLIYEELNRFLNVPLPNDARDDLFGTTTWRDALTAPTVDERRRRLHDLYQQQLKTVGGAPYVRSFEMRNKSNSTDLFLFFATKSAFGLEKMKEAMWRVAPGGAYRFSDITRRDHPVLFADVPDYAYLRRLIEARFSGQSVDVSEVHDFVVQETPFLGSHYKKGVLALMEREAPPTIEVVAAPPNRRRGTFPDGTRIRFH